MKKTIFSLLVATSVFAVSETYAAIDSPNPNDCGQYGVTYQVKTVNDSDQGYRETVEVSRPNTYNGDARATVTRERRDGSTYQTQMDSRDSKSHNKNWNTQINSRMESNSGNGDRVKSVDLQCYPNSK